MLKILFKVALLVVLAIFVLGLGGYSLSSISSEWHIKDVPVLENINKLVGDVDIISDTNDPNKIEISQDNLDKVIQENKDKDPISSKDNKDSTTTKTDKSDKSNKSDKSDKSDKNNTSSSSSSSKNDSGPGLFDNWAYSNDKVPSGEGSYSIFGNSSSKANPDDQITLSVQRIYKITYKGKEISFDHTNTLSFVKWLHQNYDDKDESSLGIEVINDDAPVAVATAKKLDDFTSIEDTAGTGVEGVNYNNILNNVRDLNVIIESIKTVDSLPDYDKQVKKGKWEEYSQDIYELPIINYTMNEKKYNRLDYSWLNSKNLTRLVPFSYKCPYTGTIITDDINLVYDHIVSLKSTYLRGAAKWTEAQRHEYAYNQWNGIAVSKYISNTKLDNGPLDYLPEINKEDYCYSWLLICSRYHLSMTEDEIALCETTIKDALADGQTVEFLGGR